MVYSYIYICSAVISMFMFYKLFKVRRSEVGFLLSVISIMTAFWLLMEGMSYFEFDERVLIFFQRVKYISIIPISPLLVATSIGMLWKYTSSRKRKVLLLFILPCISMLSLITNILPYSFVSNESVYLQKEILIYSYDREIGFYIHVVYSYILLLLNNLLLMYRAMRAQKIYKQQSIYLFFGSLLATTLNMMFIFGFFGTIAIDSTPISILATIIIYYWVAFVLPKRLVVLQARNLMIENMKDILLTVDNNDRIIDMNFAAREMVKKTSNIFGEKIDTIDFTGINFSKLLESISFATEMSHSNFDNLSNGNFEIVIDGVNHHYELIIEDLLDSENKKIGLLYILRDVTDQRNNLHNLMQLNEHLQVSDRIINEALEGIVIIDNHNKIIRVNESFVRMSGYEYYELLGESPSIMKSNRHDDVFYEELWNTLEESGQWEGEIWEKKKNGEVFPKSLSINTIKDEKGEIANYIGISSDISEKIKDKEDLRNLAYYDGLTGLPNRAFFKLKLESAINRSLENNYDIALLYIDLDRFKIINDTFGHTVGDQLLIQVALRFKECIKDTEDMSRLGGDEFTLIIEPYNENGEKYTQVNCILNAFAKPFKVNGRLMHVFPSIGFVVSNGEDVTGDDLLRKADLAMYSAKEKGRNCYVFYSEELEIQNTNLNDLEVKLGQAIKNNDFQMYLQPQISRVKGTDIIVGAEALIRWPQSDGTMISPFRFIDLAERNGMIFDIGQIVLNEVIRLYHVLANNEIEINLSFNASVKQFMNDDFYILLQELMKKEENVGINLTMEVTESLLFQNIDDAITLLNNVKQLGLKIALDDFGTGYSSMRYLSKLPIDYLKIDKSFIDEIGTDSHTSMAHMIVSMAKILRLYVVAEGVEEKDQLDSLYEVDCDIIQGYYYSKPLPINEFIEFTKRFSK